MRRSALPAATLFALLALVPACDDGGARAPADAPADQPAGEGAAIAPINRSGIAGTVRVERGDDETTVTLQLEGLTAGVEYPAHVHEGRCSAGGPVAAPLGRVRAGADGTGRLATRVSTATMPADTAGFVQVHGPDGAAVACADLDGPADMSETLREAVEAVRQPQDGGGEGEGEEGGE